MNIMFGIKIENNLGYFKRLCNHQENVEKRMVGVHSIIQFINIKISVNLSEFGLVKTLNERYLITFGGVDGENSDGICVYDTKSKIKCPVKGRFHATITNEMDEKHISKNAKCDAINK